MADEVVRLACADEPAIEALLGVDRITNLFLIGFLAVHPVDRTWWYGIGTPLRGVVLVLPGRVAVPFARTDEDAARLGAHLADQHNPCMVVGPRSACDRLWERWTGSATPRRRYDQRLYTLDRTDGRFEGADPPGFRVANVLDLEEVVRHAAAMELEDLGIDPSVESARMHRMVVQERIKAGRTFVIVDPPVPGSAAHRDRIRFQVNIGTTHSLGCQIGGTWVPPAHRGKGIATLGIEATCRRIFQHHVRVTLHVNEANLPAVRVYEKAGFQRNAPFRLIVP